MKVYVAGKITGKPGYHADFERAARALRKKGHEVLIPSVLPELPSLTHDDYMHICYAMIDVCDAVYMLPDWKDSKGARMERVYATVSKKMVLEGGEDGICKEPGDRAG